MIMESNQPTTEKFKIRKKKGFQILREWEGQGVQRVPDYAWQAHFGVYEEEWRL